MELVSDVDVCNEAYEGKLSEIKRKVQADPKLVAITDKSERTPLHWACSSGQDGVVEFLLNQGAKVKKILHPHEPH